MINLSVPAPLTIKTNSYGEFVFDWAWADAYQRNGLNYYPKLVTAIPFTPAQGPRLLSSNNHLDSDGNLVDTNTIKKGLINALIAHAEKNNLSSAHFLFCEKDDITLFKSEEFLLRFDYQFHWSNNNYSSFDDFLLNSPQSDEKILSAKDAKYTKKIFTSTLSMALI